QRAFPKFQANGAGDALLRHREKSVQSFSQGREPQAVIDKLGVAARKSLLEMRGLAVHSEALQFLVRLYQQRATWGFISAARFHAYEPVLDQIRAADTVLRGDFVQRIDKFNGAQLRAIDGNWCTGFKSN